MVLAMASNAAWLMAIRTMSGIWGGAALVTSARKAPRRGADAGALRNTRASEGRDKKHASSNSTDAPLFRQLPLRERFPREPLRSTLVWAIDKADEPINKLRCLELLREVAGHLRLRLHDQRILSYQGDQCGLKASAFGQAATTPSGADRSERQRGAAEKSPARVLGSTAGQVKRA
jgi:hypothetical protein